VEWCQSHSVVDGGAICASGDAVSGVARVLSLEVRTGRCRKSEMATFGKRVSATGVSALPTNKRSKINIYDAPPSDEVSMDEFEQFALDRMRVLKAIDQGKARGMKPDELNEVCLSAIPLNKHHLPSLDPPPHT